MLWDTDEHGDGDDLGLEDLFAEMTEEGLEQRSQTQDMPYGDEASPDVLNDDDPELFEDYIEIDDTQRENTRRPCYQTAYAPGGLWGISIFHLTLTELFA